MEFKEGDRVVAFNPDVERWKGNPTIGTVASTKFGYLEIWSDELNEIRRWHLEYVISYELYNSPLYRALK